MKRCIAFYLALVSIAVAFSISSSHAQVVKIDTLTHWKKAVRLGLNLNQASFSSNWKAGGINSVGFNVYFNYKANYKKDVHSWDNEIDLMYGMVNNAGQGMRKTLDRVFIDTRYGRAISPKWDLSASANLQSQFADGYKYTKDAAGVEQATLISGGFAPAYITAALGFEYHPKEYFKLRLSPISPRITIVNEVSRFYDPINNPTPYGVKLGDNTKVQALAFQILAEFNKDIATNINLKWRYVMFTDYQTFDFDKIDHRLDLNLTGEVNKYINVSFGGTVMYFYSQDKDVQISQALSVGVAYSFRNFAEKE